MRINYPLSWRGSFLALFAACVGVLAMAVYLQYVKGIEPCPMCAMQRYAFFVIGIIALVGGVHAPREKASRRIYDVLVAIVALTGAGIAARQSWLQWFPPEFGECGPGLQYILDEFPLVEALSKIFRGSGDCSTVDWTFLGLSIANWSFVAFVAVFGLMIFLFFRRH